MRRRLERAGTIAVMTLAMLLAMLFVEAAGAAHAQTNSMNTGDSVDTTKPIVVKNPKASKPKPGKFLGQVLSSTPKSITVRSKDNLMAVRTFAFAANLSSPGLPYGQNVEIDYAPGSDVASRIKLLSPSRR